jgi:hypothetical protein
MINEFGELVEINEFGELVEFNSMTNEFGQLDEFNSMINEFGQLVKFGYTADSYPFDILDMAVTDYGYGRRAPDPFYSLYSRDARLEFIHQTDEEYHYLLGEPCWGLGWHQVHNPEQIRENLYYFDSNNLCLRKMGKKLIKNFIEKRNGGDQFYHLQKTLKKFVTRKKTIRGIEKMMFLQVMRKKGIPLELSIETVNSYFDTVVKYEKFHNLKRRINYKYYIRAMVREHDGHEVYDQNLDYFKRMKIYNKIK